MIYLSTALNDNNDGAYVNMLLKDNKVTFYVDRAIKNGCDELIGQFSMNIKCFSELEKIVESFLKSASKLLFEIHAEESNIMHQFHSQNKNEEQKPEEEIDLIKSFGVLRDDQIIN